MFVDTEQSNPNLRLQLPSSPKSMSPPPPPPMLTNRRTGLNLGDLSTPSFFPPSTPAADSSITTANTSNTNDIFHHSSTASASAQEPFAFRQPFTSPTPLTPLISPWQNLFVSSGAPTPSLFPLDSPFNPIGSLNFPSGDAGEVSAAGGSNGVGVFPGVSRTGPTGFSIASSPPPAMASRFQRMSLSTSGKSSKGEEVTGTGKRLNNLSTSPSVLPVQNSTPHSFSSTANRMLGGPSGGSIASRRAKSAMAPSNPHIQMLDPSDIPVPIPHTYLILDLRTHNSYTHSRVPTAIPITIPSTLLRRANFTLARLVPMLDQESDQARIWEFQKGPDAITRIICYDQDGQSAGEGGILAGLLNKFEKDGFKGKLCIVRGGFAAVSKSNTQGLVDNSPLAEQAKPSKSVNGRDLPLAAFQQVSTNGGAPTVGFTLPGMDGSGKTLTMPQTAGLQHKAANPFFDNIRQNIELSHGIGERIPLDLPSSTVERAGDLPSFLRDIILASPSQAADTLAQQFYKVELGEQKRLQGIMNHHSKFGDAGSDESGDNKVDRFPYSITAGLEKGWKNRFQNIWPFDHARVRLEAKCHDDGSDYINASLVQPRATNKKYIATQGPLPSTYQDFWTLCWEQNVRVIVMLTKQHEGGQVKCGDYWSDRKFGRLTLQLLEVKGEEENMPGHDGGGGFFAAAAPKTSEPRPLIKRSFLVTHDDHPEEPGRLITQIQYVSWPDFDIPETPEDLLNLIREVNQINDEAGVQAHITGQPSPGPIVVHCSAGVGRTGSYVVVDAVLDAIKHEMQLKREAKPSRDRKQTLDRSRNPSVSSSSPFASSAPTSSPPPGSPFFDLRAARSPTSRPRSRDDPTNGPRVSDMDIDYSAVYNSKDTSRSGSPATSDADENSSLFSTHTGSTTSLINLGNMHIGSNGRRSSVPFNLTKRPSFTTFHSTGSPLLSNSLKEDSPSFVSTSTTTSTSTPTSVATPSESMSYQEGLPPPRCTLSTQDVTLSDLQDPVLNVLEDMREQRMSLCQTLRQFVFAYRVIIQGTLDMVEEERRMSSSLDSSDDRKRHAEDDAYEGSRGGLIKRPSLKLPKVRARRPSKATPLSNSSSALSEDILPPNPGPGPAESATNEESIS
ncbi:Protein tyrosine phosphatase [Phaffia rhodozyma]|uniref:protein-tyrosine-phosphatase n=1 Tax=Phaffia rhodozyma TaxID=264483 RepID=A0A0F7SQY7_PHARH|nr:Protein tyrosine phosphatase [Phaffia rhodozyma]